MPTNRPIVACFQFLVGGGAEKAPTKAVRECCDKLKVAHLRSVYVVFSSTLELFSLLRGAVFPVPEEARDCGSVNEHNLS